MDLIWSKADFSAEFKKYIGFVDSDIPFIRMESALRASTSEITDLIGLPQYEIVKAAPVDPETTFPKLVKYAILLRALIIYTPTADIAFTARGRKTRNDEHDGTPWQWMLDANIQALDNLYYRHLDLLLKHMFTNSIPVNVKKYDHKELFVSSLDMFERHFNINGSYYLYLKLLPALQECEDLELLPRIGPLPLNQFSPAMKNIAEKCCVFYALDWGMRRLNIQLFPEGVLQTSLGTVNGSVGKNYKPSDKLQYLETAMTFKNDCQKYLGALEGMIRKATNVKQLYPNQVVLDSGIYGDDGFIDT
ncbi:hypothetical protein [Chryseobacterium sp. MP_3.2]|uniref:hypothetical protein n=1 Tax=Chryseobacterium sp. MP_3.2 TaxID=3071712 RepID=UPI002DFCD037|nr:hypothetical protein [Chryseobacterium sp. MP_3.2]